MTVRNDFSLYTVKVPSKNFCLSPMSLMVASLYIATLTCALSPSMRGLDSIVVESNISVPVELPQSPEFIAAGPLLSDPISAMPQFQLPVFDSIQYQTGAFIGTADYLDPEASNQTVISDDTSLFMPAFVPARFLEGGQFEHQESSNVSLSVDESDIVFGSSGPLRAFLVSGFQQSELESADAEDELRHLQA